MVVEQGEDIIPRFNLSQPLLVNGVCTQGLVQPSEAEQMIGGTCGRIVRSGLLLHEERPIAGLGQQ